MPLIETCFNCFGNHSSDTKEIIKELQNRPGNSKVLQPNTAPPPPWQESGRCQDGASACTLQDAGQDQYNRYGPVPDRYTIHQSTPHVLSAYRDQSMQGEGKKEIFSNTLLGTESKEEEVSGFLVVSIM